MASKFEQLTHKREDFLELLQGLNGALGQAEMPVFQWTTARKQHEDLFGDIIQIGEEYLRRTRPGLGWDQEIKLSIRSMDRLILAIHSPGSPLDVFLQEMKDRPNKILRRHADAASIGN